MEYIELKNNEWTNRNPVSRAFRPRFTPYVQDNNGGELINGVRLRKVEWDDPSIDTPIYVVPAARPMTYAEKLKATPLEETGRTLRVAVYCPKLAELSDETPEQRINRMKKAVADASVHNVDVFLGPEYFFTRNSSQLSNRISGADHTYTIQEFAAVQKAIVDLGKEYPSMLLIPGTTLWKDSDNEVRNTGYVCHFLEQGYAHSKKTSHDDAAYATVAGGHYEPGDSHFYDFEFQGLRARYEICADTGQGGKSAEGKEMHLISGYNFGGGMPAQAHAGGVEVLSDGAGDGRIERPFVAEGPKAKPADNGIYVQTVEVKKAVNAGGTA